jgi:hypothetical protein
MGEAGGEGVEPGGSTAICPGRGSRAPPERAPESWKLQGQARPQGPQELFTVDH